MYISEFSLSENQRRFVTYLWNDPRICNVM